MDQVQDYPTPKGVSSLCPDHNCTCSQECAVTTRAGADKSPDRHVKPLRCLDFKKGLQFTSVELRREQQSDSDLQRWREYALHGHYVGSKQKFRFQMKQGLLYRVFDKKGESTSRLNKQLHTSAKLRHIVLAINTASSAYETHGCPQE
ncbi:hypothetical protein Pcinc_028749 [Petrolisthes cinctipes]|uniref:Uncharacterized protein n=1 Tax=Petrolisthes cinctipes TaxID=88211 RepID=A0AAE1F299_PETCI|nr:hypothetical protein Pcinc_028749 [Petrolisthes cinctipes]